MRNICCGKIGSSCQHSKELKISKLTSIQAEFISNIFSGKTTGLASVGEIGIGPQSLCPEDLHSLQGEMRELHTDWWVKA